MNFKLLKECRICSKNDFIEIINLGYLAFTGKFSNKSRNVSKAPIVLIKCSNCHLVQLKNNFSPDFLYAKDYGYRSGINQTMRNHLLNITKKIGCLIKFKNNDVVLDIASNDGTLLKSYKNKKIRTFGIDPTIKKFRKYYKNIDFKVPNFFDKSVYFSKIKKKAKVITAISVFYDLLDPNKFLDDVKSVLHDDGIFIIEQSDLYLMLKNNSVDTICHEHLEYYSIYVINNLIKSHSLKIFKHEFNSINGGSSRFYICHEKNKKFKHCESYINFLIKKEKNYGMFNNKIFKGFINRINFIKKNILKKLQQIKKNNQIIHGYGASTKGNVILQYFNIGKYLDFISDKNINKVNLYTPGTKIKIISEKKSRALKPNYYFVLPWHFKKEIIKREKLIISKGTKFIFPFPSLNII